ncbi:MAG: hypothetical protein IJ428_03730 [Clostridia bacterium]|nr:hypothetical protein [Clostridia bacterium]
MSHDNVDGYACCYVYIKAYEGTDKIDNVNIKLYRSVGSVLIIEESWENLSVAGDEFEFYDEVADVPTGYAYRLQVTADVHRYGVVESLDLYHDVYYD